MLGLLEFLAARAPVGGNGRLLALLAFLTFTEPIYAFSMYLTIIELHVGPRVTAQALFGPSACLPPTLYSQLIEF